MVSIIWGSSEKPVACEELAKYFESRKDLDGHLYLGYPIIGSVEGAVSIDGLLVSPNFGVVLFHLVEGNRVNDFEEIQDNYYSKIQARLLQSRQLIKSRKLAVEITTITYAPGYVGPKRAGDDHHLATNNQELSKILDETTWSDFSLFSQVLSVIQSITSIRRTKNKRQVLKDNSRGDKLRHLEESIATLDQIQASAVIETAEGVQRIRGLAGSGKTIVLALKVAYLHAKNPDWDIAVTFNTRALKGQFERLISQFVMEQTNEEPNWEKIRIINAWGAPGGREKEGLYYLYCSQNGLTYLDYRTALAKFGQHNEFDGACTQALSECFVSRQIFDLILVDEAQDLSPSFLRICYQLLRDPHRLIYAYDELQSLTKKSMPGPEEIFGLDKNGNPLVNLRNDDGKPKQDIVLSTCYRNSKPLLTTAHALGFGIYRQPEGLIQMFDREALWEDIGYSVVDGSLNEGNEVTLERTKAASPSFLEDHSPVDDLVCFKSFATEEEQTAAVVEEIRKNIQDDELRPDDIIVINPNPLTTQASVAPIRSELMQLKINSVLAGVSTSPDIFYVDGRVTFTGIFRAKGNEAGMVYIINAQDCFEPGRADLAQARNRLFTAMTRSKAWVRVFGVGTLMDGLVEEFQRVKTNNFALKFKYPTKEDRERLNILNRDMSEQERKSIRSSAKEMKALVDAIERGNSSLSDYPKDVVEKLKKILSGN